MPVLDDIFRAAVVIPLEPVPRLPHSREHLCRCGDRSRLENLWQKIYIWGQRRQRIVHFYSIPQRTTTVHPRSPIFAQMARRQITRRTPRIRRRYGPTEGRLRQNQNRLT